MKTNETIGRREFVRKTVQAVTTLATFGGLAPLAKSAESLLAGFLAKLYDTDAVKKLKVE